MENQQFVQKTVVLSTSDFGVRMFARLKEDPAVNRFYWRADHTPQRYDQLARFLYAEIIRQIFEVMDEDFHIFWTSVETLPRAQTIVGNKGWERESGLLEMLKKYVPEMAMHLYNLLREYRLLSTPGLIPIQIYPEQILLGATIHELPPVP